MKNRPLTPAIELCTFAVDCINKTAPSTLKKTPYKMIRTSNIRNGSINTSDVRYVTKETFERWTKRSRQAFGDVILTREAPVGEVGRVTFTEEDHIFLGQRLFHYRPDPKKTDWNYFAYALKSKEVQDRIHGKSFGSTVPHIKVGDAENLLIPTPPLSEQRKIGHILSSYDDLITTNQRRIALLEEAARLIYREWFVNLRFPVHNSTKTRNKSPEGWNTVPLSEIADFVNGFAFKPEHQNPTGLPIVKIPELRDGISEKTPRNPGTNIPIKNHITTGDIIFSWSATLLVNEWADGPALLNQHLFKVIPKKLSHKRFIRFSIENAIPFLLENSVGTTMQHIRRSSLDKHTINLPNDKVINEFTSLVNPMIDLSLALQTANRQLATARDLLLPKLMSGQIDVSNIRLPDEDVVT